MSLSLVNLKCEHKVNPLGIDIIQPRLSWQLQTDRRGVIQTAYQIRVTCGDVPVWDSGRVESDCSHLVSYGGPALSSGQRCEWRVRVWDNQGQVSDWSEPAWWEMGLLNPDDWVAQWIEPEWPEDPSVSNPCPMLRKTFSIDGQIKAARLYVTAHGLYEAELNGRKVGEQVLTPGWTVYSKRLHYQTYDVGGQLVSGENALGVTLADGWYRGNLGFRGQRNVYGDRLALLLQLKIEYTDGRVQWVCSDETWKAGTGPIRAADIYNGESYDARLDMPGWSCAGFDDAGWSGVRVVDYPKEVLCAPAGPPVLKIEEIKPVKILTTPAGDTVVDMGQNMVGWVRLRVQGPAGQTVTLRHAEVLDKEGNFYTANLRSAKQTDTYTLKGEGIEIWEPRFTFHGFRYVAVAGYPGELTLDSLTGIVVHSAIAPIGHWESDNPLLNRLWHNIVWGQKGNFVDVPTDCPQRDERLGWTGDAQVFIRTACFNMDVAAFFTKWLRDLAADQAENGSVPFVIPNVLGPNAGGSAAWADAATICPWTIYLCYGDTRLLAEQYASMKAWVGYMEAQAGDGYLWNTGFHFGDWLSYNSPDPGGSSAITDKDLIATAFFAYSTSLVGQAAEVLGKTEDAQHYAELLKNIKAAFVREFVTPNGRVGNNTQTAYALALMFDLLPTELRAEAARRLAADVRKRDTHLSTGFVGTPYLCYVLSQNGYLDVAYDLLNQESYPSWLYPVKMGATTIWERWDGIKPDGTFQDAGMNSFNHYAYGAIGEWMVRVVAGLEVDPRQPGYKHILVQPQPGGRLGKVKARLLSPYGKVKVAWEVSDEGAFVLRVIVPANSTATVRIPFAQPDAVTESGVPLAQAQGVLSVAQAGEAVIVEVGSGDYRFVAHAPIWANWPKGRPRLSTHSTLGELIGNEAARAVLLKYLAPLAGSPEIGMAMQMSLREAAVYAGDLLSAETLDAIDRELAALP